VHPPTSPARANFTLMTECTPESSRCYSVYSVEGATSAILLRTDGGEGVRQEIDQGGSYIGLFL
jgi:hypothetical protein